MWRKMTLCLFLGMAVRIHADASGPRQFNGGTSEPVNYTQQHDIIYGDKHGMALIMDAFTPVKANGISVLWIVSGSGRSSRQKLAKASHQKCIQGLLARGYTVFGVMHGSVPRYTLQDVVKDIHRAVRFVRFHAQDYGIDPQRIGAAGASAAGNLALMMGCAGCKGDPQAQDPVESVSSNVQAVGCFFAPSDWLNIGEKGVDIITFQQERYHTVDAAFLFQEYRKDQDRYVVITEQARIREIMHELSPITYVSKDTAPTLIIHGEKDPFVPVQQGQVMVQRLIDVGVAAELKIKAGLGHGWPAWEEDITYIADWFDNQL